MRWAGSRALHQNDPRWFDANPHKRLTKSNLHRARRARDRAGNVLRAPGLCLRETIAELELTDAASDLRGRATRYGAVARVLLVIDSSAAWSRGILRGFAQVAHEHG